MKRSAIAAVSSILMLAGLVSLAFAVETEGGYVGREREVYRRSPLVIDVWTSRGEGAVYYPGERIRVYFRASRDCYATVYNIDSQGYVHLLYPARAFDSHFIMGGVTYRLPSRRDPYDFVVSGPQGVEYIEAIASMEPFHSRLPWYLDPEYGEWEEDPWALFGHDYEYYAEDYDYFVDRGVVRGDPFLGIQRINRQMIPPDYPSWNYATAYTSFYVNRRVAYPRYVCYDCHWYHPRFDPYGMGCLVFDVRIDRTWVYSPRIVIRDYRPRYYYRVKDTAPVRYKGKRHFWSSKDGLRKLKKEFSPSKLKVGPGKLKLPPGDREKGMKEWGPSRLKKWKPGKSPSSKKLEGLRKRLEVNGVLKPKSGPKEPKVKREISKPKREVKPSRKKEKRPSYEKKEKTKSKETSKSEEEKKLKEGKRPKQEKKPKEGKRVREGKGLKDKKAKKEKTRKA